MSTEPCFNAVITAWRPYWLAPVYPPCSVCFSCYSEHSQLLTGLTLANLASDEDCNSRRVARDYHATYTGSSVLGSRDRSTSLLTAWKSHHWNTIMFPCILVSCRCYERVAAVADSASAAFTDSAWLLRPMRFPTQASFTFVVSHVPLLKSHTAQSNIDCNLCRIRSKASAC